ncbi:MAG TPA: MBL fold metallo-hydrolase [Halanaerobiales bacterium]|nr:MBL fold metallo-hydrolase [Halanaerobiales bacterium]
MFKKSILILGLIILIITFNTMAVAEDLSMTIIYDNYSYQENLSTDWGFSCYIEGLHDNILFDTGKNGVILLDNMERLAIKPEIIDTIILSHHHQDHTGGLNDFLNSNNEVDVYIPNSFLDMQKQNIKQAGANLINIVDSTKICDSVFSTGELGVVVKEQSLIIKTNKGLVIITGCAHPGVVKIVKKAKELYSEDIYLLMGGFHLNDENTSEIKEIAEQLKKEGVIKVAPSHCSGDKARNIFSPVFKDNYIISGVGKKIIIKNSFENKVP